MKKSQAQLKLAYEGEWGNDIDLVCTRENVKPITPTVLSTSFKNYLIINGLPGIRFHDLRHTNTTIMLAAGIHVKAAENRLGHSKFQTTLDIYSHVLQSVDRESAEKIRAVLSR
ncbi:tyrosine-type recombinase/integrase [Clostridium thermarum]|uniref:tyrosine-type recombinase/integrase n=1 Tax=Clostridium thermarum TaxID=1716543 RepID=UPI0013D4D983